MKKQTTFYKVLLYGALFFQTQFVFAQIQVTLTPSNYNGYNISCFGKRNGSITANVTGGTPPYNYEWSNAATSATVNNLAAGYYTVRVHDADPNMEPVDVEITLVEPEPLKLTLTASDYLVNNRHYNISLNGVCNATVTTTVTEGVAPYTYLWTPTGQTSANLFNICSGNYIAVVTDANGCSTSREQVITQPDRDDWGMSGNSNSNPGANFIGTSDNKDFVFKTNNNERMRFKANGEIKIPGLGSNTGSYASVYVDSLGNLKVSGFNSACFASWYANPLLSTLTANCSNLKVGIGTYYPIFDFELFKATALNETVRMKCQTGVAKNAEIWSVNTQGSFALATDNTGKGHIFKNINTPTSIITFDNNGKVGIGVDPPSSSSLNYNLYVENGIMTRDVKVTASTPFPDYVFDKNYKRKSIYEFGQYIRENQHLPDMPSAKEVEKNNGYEVGVMITKLVKQNEEQSLYILDLQSQIDELKQVINLNKKGGKK